MRFGRQGPERVLFLIFPTHASFPFGAKTAHPQIHHWQVSVKPATIWHQATTVSGPYYPIAGYSSGSLRCSRLPGSRPYSTQTGETDFRDQELFRSDA